MQKVILHMLLGIVAALFIPACSTDTETITEIDTEKDAQKVTVNFSYTTLGKPETSLRAMTPTDENKINEVTILAFKKTGPSSYILEYHTKSVDIVQTSTSVTFTAWLRRGDQKFIIITNASAQISNLINTAGITAGESFSSVLPKLKVSSINEWPAGNNGQLLQNIPMYGEIDSNITYSTTAIGSSSSYLIRMLARIDISLTTAVKSKLELTEAYVFNRKQAGRIAYDPSPLKWNATDNKVITATMPSPVSTKKLPDYKYEATASEIVQSIYTFEAEGTVLSKDATAIVIGGKFNGSSDITYYRVDIPPTKSNYMSGDILRNHLYKIIVQDVKQTGAPTPEEAFDGIYTLEAVVEEWEEAYNGIVLDPQYYLYVNHNSLSLQAAQDPDGCQIIASTDHPLGITVGSATGIGSIGGGADGDMYRVLTIKSSTAGSFIIKAGNMQLKVEVK